jgi:hypothetical protein
MRFHCIFIYEDEDDDYDHLKSTLGIKTKNNVSKFSGKYLQI